MTQLIGIDVGGTHTRIRVQAAHGVDSTENVEQKTITMLSNDWLTGEGLSDPAGSATLLKHAYELGASQESPLAIGAHGCDSLAQIEGFRAALQANHSGPVTVVNDAFLLAPAAGFTHAIGVIAGTGSIVVGANDHGELLTAGGLGWMIGDPGSAPGITREAMRAVFVRNNDGHAPDALGTRLLAAYDTDNVDDLAMLFSRTADIHRWAAFAPQVFEAADEGSVDAANVITEAGALLAKDVTRLLSRGVRAEAIVTAGGVMVNQPRLQQALAAGLTELSVELELRILTDDPVSGAIQLARRSFEPRTSSTTQPTN